MSSAFSVVLLKTLILAAFIGFGFGFWFGYKDSDVFQWPLRCIGGFCYGFFCALVGPVWLLLMVGGWYGLMFLVRR